MLETLPEGWLTPAEAEVLRRHARGKLVLEIGSWKGRSTVVLAEVAKHLVAVDHHKGSVEHGPEALSLPDFVANLGLHGVREKVSVCVMDSARLVTFFKPANFELVFVDGSHDFGSATRDGHTALHLVKPEGVVIFHDYTPNWPGVQNAVRNISAAYPGWRLEEVEGLAVLHLS